jgi:hypothetical protein
MVEDTKTFKVGWWLAEILQSLGSYRTIHQFITSPEALHAYLDTVEVMTGSEQGVQVTDDAESIKRWHGMLSQDVRKAGSSYGNQMIVLASTYLELILKDFLTAAFTRHPDKMYDFIQTGGDQVQRGAVSLKEIVKADSLPQLLGTLADRATDRIVRGPFPAQLKHLSKLVQRDVPAELKDRLTALVARRNRVVHEASDESVGEADVEAALDTCLDTVRFLAEVAAANSIPLDEYATFGL